MEIDWLPIINFVLAGVSSVVIPAATAWGWSMAQKIKLNAINKNIKSNSDIVSERISQAVSATEQRAKSGVLKKSEKKAFCLSLVKRMLVVDKKEVPDDILTELIETQIWEDDKPIVTTEVLKMETPVLTRLSPPIVGTIEETSSNERG